MKFFWKKILDLLFVAFLGSLLSCNCVFAKSEPKTLIYSNPRSGVNMFCASMMAILRKPVGEYPDQIQINNTGRLSLDLVSKVPFGYRTHWAKDVIEGRNNFSKLILITRNPKEKLFRDLSIKKIGDVTSSFFAAKYLSEYFKYFEVFESWPEDKRMLIFYEDLVEDLENQLFKPCEFLGEDPVFFDDFLQNKELYLDQIRESYINTNTKSGKSSIDGAEVLFYTRNQNPELLKQIDEYLKELKPKIWVNYLTRFEEK